MLANMLEKFIKHFSRRKTDKMIFDKVQKSFRDYCQPRKNVLFESHTFWNLLQDEGETVDAYITKLRLQADCYDYDKEGWPAAVINGASQVCNWSTRW